MRKVSCFCKKVTCEAHGTPIVSAVCYCADCQAAGQEIARLPGAAQICEQDGGTPYSTYRQDQWVCVSGAEHLMEHKLHANAPTTRYVARCCHSAMFLKFTYGFWVSVYQFRFEEPAPPLEWRHRIAARKSDLPYRDDLPLYAGFPIKLFLRLLRAGALKMLGR